MRRVLAFLGAMLVLVAIAVGAGLLVLTFRALLSDATRPKHTELRSALLPPLARVDICSPLGADILFPARVISINESRALLVVLSNWSPCDQQTTLAVYAPDFTVEPIGIQTVMVPAHSEYKKRWILSPRRAGEFTVVVDTPHLFREVGVTVTNIFGLSSRDASVLALFGGTAGPLLTLPYWFDLWRDWRRRRKAEPRRNQGIGFRTML
jgi:hypothetical protein